MGAHMIELVDILNPWVVELVGPKGYVHGWVKVGMEVEHKDGSKGTVTKYDPNTQTAHVDFKSGPRAGKANKVTTKAYHLKQGAGLGPGHVDKPEPKQPDTSGFKPNATHRYSGERVQVTGKPTPNGFVSIKHASGSDGQVHQDHLKMDPVKPKDEQEFQKFSGDLGVPAKKAAPKSEGQELSDNFASHPEFIAGATDKDLDKANRHLTNQMKTGTTYDSDTHARVRVEQAHRAKAAAGKKSTIGDDAPMVKNIKGATDERLSERRKVLDPKRKAGQTTPPEENELEAIKDEQRTRRAVKRGGPIVSGTTTPAEGAKFKDTIGKIIKEGPTNAPPLVSLQVGAVMGMPGMTVIADMNHEGRMRVTNKMNLHSDAVTRKHQAMERNGWFSAAEKGETSAHSQLSHEYGHHLDFAMSPSVRYAMLKDVGMALGFKNQELVRHNPSGEFTPAEKAVIVNKVGTYAATNNRELVAELYKSSRLAANPSTAAKVVGSYMDDMFGASSK